MTKTEQPLVLLVAITKGKKRLSYDENGKIDNQHQTYTIVTKADFDNTIESLVNLGFDFVKVKTEGKLQSAGGYVGKEYYASVIEGLFGVTSNMTPEQKQLAEMKAKMEQQDELIKQLLDGKPPVINEGGNSDEDIIIELGSLPKPDKMFKDMNSDELKAYMNENGIEFHPLTKNVESLIEKINEHIAQNN